MTLQNKRTFGCSQNLYATLLTVNASLILSFIVVVGILCISQYLLSAVRRRRGAFTKRPVYKFVMKPTEKCRCVHVAENYRGELQFKATIYIRTNRVCQCVQQGQEYMRGRGKKIVEFVEQRERDNMTRTGIVKMEGEK